jgi:hypothetical protein
LGRIGLVSGHAWDSGPDILARIPESGQEGNE